MCDCCSIAEPAIDHTDAEGYTALSIAARQEGNEAVVRLLLDRGAAIDHTDAEGYTALSIAARQEGNEAVVRLLLDRGAAIDLVDADGYTALSIARQEGHDTIVQLLLERGAVFPPEHEETIHSPGYSSEYSPRNMLPFNPSEKKIIDKVWLDNGLGDKFGFHNGNPYCDRDEYYKKAASIINQTIRRPHNNEDRKWEDIKTLCLLQKDEYYDEKLKQKPIRPQLKLPVLNRSRTVYNKQDQIKSTCDSMNAFELEDKDFDRLNNYLHKLYNEMSPEEQKLAITNNPNCKQLRFIKYTFDGMALLDKPVITRMRSDEFETERMHTYNRLERKRLQDEKDFESWERTWVRKKMGASNSPSNLDFSPPGTDVIWFGGENRFAIGFELYNGGLAKPAGDERLFVKVWIKGITENPVCQMFYKSSGVNSGFPRYLDTNKWFCI